MARWVRVGGGALVASVTVFVLLTSVAALTYPGGNWIDPGHSGFHVWHNFICDLLMSPAINGVPSRLAAVTSQIAMLVLVAGFVPLWLLVPRLFAERDARMQPFVRACGLLSVAALVGVPLTTSVELHWLHGSFIALAGVPGFGAAVLAAAGIWRNRDNPAWLRFVTVAAVLVSLVDFALYLNHFLYPSDLVPLLPALQKVAIVLVLAWMLAVAGRFFAGVPRLDGGPGSAAGSSAS
jgi:hypothetical protein